MENTAYISLGSNMGDRYKYLIRAIERLTSNAKIDLVNYSSIYETDPVGYTDQDQFLNMVIKVNTDLNAYQLLDKCMETELALGRKRDIHWGPRTIDLDILMYNHENIETDALVVPHPRMMERAFVLIPLIELDADISFFNMKKPITAWIEQLPDREGVRIWKRKNGEDVFVPFGS